MLFLKLPLLPRYGVCPRLYWSANTQQRHARNRRAETPHGEWCEFWKMSDVLPKEILKALKFDIFKNHFRVDTDHCLKYVRRQNVSNKNIILTAHLPYDCVRVWCRARQAALAKQIPCSFIQIFNTFLYERTEFKVRNDSQLFETRLRTATNINKVKFVFKNGAAYRKLCQN